MNDNAPFQRSKSSSVEEVARRWFAHRRSEGSSDSQADFKAWLDAAPDHAAAYKQVEQDFAQAEILKASSLYGIGRPQPSLASRHHRGWIASASAVAATLILVLFQHGTSKMHEPSPVPTQSTVSLATKHGEIRTERLSDGSQITLDTDSRLELNINGHERRIHLASGHIRLSIAKDSRPFRVDAGTGVITAPMASETSFDIGYDDTQRVRVTMITGNAKARPLLQTAKWSVPFASLDAGQSLGWSAQGVTKLTESASPARIDAAQWPTGWVSYQTVPLEELVAQANQYADRPIILDSPDVGAIKVSGRFHISEPAHLASNLADVFGLDLIKTSRTIHLHRK